jgi:tripartite-type tricarboxylate transporter receptor subunit TctC
MVIAKVPPRSRQRRALLAGTAALALPVPPALAQPAQLAQTWPRTHLKILVAYPPGGVSDLVARALSEQLSALLGVPVPVDNRPGASGTLAVEQLARSAPDGMLLGFAAATAVGLMRAHAARRAGLAEDGPLPVTPVAGVMRTPMLLVGTPALRAERFEDMLAEARRLDGGMRWATTGEGTTGHAVLQRIAQATGIGFVHVPYKGGGQQLNDALAGHFELLSTNVAPLQLQALREHRFKALAVGAPQRLAALPQVPTLAELGHGPANLDSLFGLFAPPRTPADLVERMHAAVSRALETPALRARLLAANNQPFEGTPQAFEQQVLREVRR